MARAATKTGLTGSRRPPPTPPRGSTNPNTPSIENAQEDPRAELARIEEWANVLRAALPEGTVYYHPALKRRIPEKDRQKDESMADFLQRTVGMENNEYNFFLVQCHLLLLPMSRY